MSLLKGKFLGWWRGKDHEEEENLWQALEKDVNVLNSSQGQTEASLNLWDGVKADIFLNYVPAQQSGIIEKEIITRKGRHYVLKNGITRSYFSLSEEHYWIWKHLDGIKTVKRLIVAYSLEFKTLVRDPSSFDALIVGLRDANMLNDPPQAIYRELSRKIREGSLLYKLGWLPRILLTHELAIKGLDTHLDRIDRKLGRFLFSVPIQVILILVSCFGMYLFLELFCTHDFSNQNSAGQLGLLGLLFYLTILIHEFGHAITAKHIGCEVYKGGFMLYYGLPAAFVDTTDAWMFGKREKLEITWAGPYTGYMIAGMCSLFVRFVPLPSPVVSETLLQLALFAATLSTFNLLPLVKLDGYYLLSDAIETPRLRERAMDFFRYQLSVKIKQRQKWTAQDLLFFTYGLIGFLSTIYFTWTGLLFWDWQAGRSISNLLYGKGELFANIGSVAMIFLAASSLIYLLVFLSSGLKQFVQWLERKDFFSTPGKAALVVVFCILSFVAILWVALPQSNQWIAPIAGMAFFGVAAWLALGNIQSLRGSKYRWLWLVSALGLISGMGRFVSDLGDKLPLPIQLTIWGPRLLIIEIVLMVLFIILVGRQLRSLTSGWRSTSLLLFAVGIILYNTSFIQFDEGALPNWLTLPVLRSGASCLVLGGLIHFRLRPESMFEIQKLTNGVSTREKLLVVYNWLRSILLSEIQLDYGVFVRSRVENGNSATRRSGAEEKDFSLDSAAITPGEIGIGMAVELDELLGNVRSVAGDAYMRRVLAYGYDSLNWDLQELAEDYILRFVSRARGLSSGLTDISNDLETLIKSVPLFRRIKHRRLNRLSKQFEPRYFAPNSEIIRAGEAGTTFYVIRTGRAEVLSADGKTLTHLGRGDYFGEIALLTNERRNATVRTLTAVEALELNRAKFDRFIHGKVKFDEKAKTNFSRLALLRTIPVFAQLDVQDLLVIAEKLEPLMFRDGQVICKQGEMGGAFYIIERGDVHLEIDSSERARMGAGEYFGETSLLESRPYMETVIALQPTVLLRLRSSDFEKLLKSSVSLQKGIERTSSRRLRLDEQVSGE